MTPQVFARRVDEIIATACADALAPVMRSRPALLRAVQRGDARVLWTVGGWCSPDEVAHAVAPCGGGHALAVVVTDALARPVRSRPDASTSSVATISDLDRAKARKALARMGRT